MALYTYLQKAWKNPDSAVWKDRLIKWRAESNATRIDHPTRLDRAHALGYKAKQGVFLVRVRLKRGSRRREQVQGGRRSAAMSMRLDLGSSYQVVAEQRAVKAYPNCEVLNSYFAAKDGNHYWYEVILVDRTHPSVLASKQLRQVAQHKGRVFRGLTKAGKKSRGFRRKGFGTEQR